MAKRRSSSTPARAAGAADVSGIAACVEDVAHAARDKDKGRPDPTTFGPLRAALMRAMRRLPPTYQDGMAMPLVTTLDRMGPAGFRRLLASDRSREGDAGTLLDTAQAVLQSGDGAATDAFQEVVSDLYDGFLSAEDRRGIKLPERGVLPPLVKFGRPEYGPYTIPVDGTAALGADTGIVSLPPGNARHGLCVWAALGHETAGHDVMGADRGLRGELADALRAALRQAGQAAQANYWADRIDETASDVMGILNMGPAAGVGLLATFRGLRLAWGEGPHLQSVGASDDEHPADVVRGFLAAATIRALPFAGSAAWADAIDQQTTLDARVIRLGRLEVTLADARGAATAAAGAVAGTRVRSLDGHALGEIQTWRDADEAAVKRLRAALTGTGKVTGAIERGDYAAHAVAAAVMEAVGGGDPARLQPRLVAMLVEMHRHNPAWGQLRLIHRGDLRRRPFLERAG